MKVRSLEIRRVEIPFRKPFEHASARRAVSETVWVEARSAAGGVGYGEGCPRQYVTGESLASAAAFFATHRDSLIAQVHGLADLRRWTATHRATLDRHPAAWCAVELALLDLMAREAGLVVEELLGVGPLRGVYRYTAVVGSGDPGRLRETVREYRRLGFTDFKIKLTGDAGLDREALGELRSSQSRRDLRVRADLNNAFRSEARAAAYLEELAAPLCALEEPLAAGQLAALSRLAERFDLPIVLDESLLRAEQLEGLVGPPERWIVNLRVSKMGGLLRSLELLEQVRARGMRVIVGSHVGETSLLTRAGLTVAEQAGDLLVAQEGAFGLHLLSEDVCAPSLEFGRGGRLPARAAVGTGLGLGIELAESFSCFAPL